MLTATRADHTICLHQLGLRMGSTRSAMSKASAPASRDTPTIWLMYQHLFRRAVYFKFYDIVLGKNKLYCVKEISNCFSCIIDFLKLQPWSDWGRLVYYLWSLHETYNCRQCYCRANKLCYPNAFAAQYSGFFYGF